MYFYVVYGGGRRRCGGAGRNSLKNEVVKELHFLVGRPIEGATQSWYGYFNIDWWWY